MEKPEKNKIKTAKANPFLQGYFGSQVMGKFGTVTDSAIYPYYENVYTKVPEQVTLHKVDDGSDYK